MQQCPQTRPGQQATEASISTALLQDCSDTCISKNYYSLTIKHQYVAPAGAQGSSEYQG